MKPIVPFVLSAALVLGQSGLRGPVTGQFFDARSGLVRPLLGLPGGAHAGQPAARQPLAWAFPAPSGNFAFAGTAASPETLVLLMGFDQPELVVMELARLAAPPRRAAFGNACAVIAGPELVAITGIGGTPLIAAIALPEGAGEVDALAVDSACSQVVVAAGDRLYRSVAPGEPLRDFLAPGAVAGLALAADGQTAFVAARDLRQLLRIDDVFGDPRLSTLATGSDGIARPVGLAVAGELLLLADAGAPTLFAFDARSGALQHVQPLSFAPTRCELLNREGTVVLTEGSRSPLWVVDTRPGGAVAFIPFE